MKWTRRTFLASSAALCASAAVVGKGITSSKPKGRVQLLRSKGETPASAFERGAHAALAGSDVVLDNLQIPPRPDLTQWRALAAELRSGIVLGMVTAAEFVLINELVRDTGTRLLYQGEHSLHASGFARHVLTSGASTRDIRAALMRPARAWPDSLGFALTGIAIRPYESSSLVTEACVTAPDAAKTSSCVSFIIAA